MSNSTPAGISEIFGCDAAGKLEIRDRDAPTIRHLSPESSSKKIKFVPAIVANSSRLPFRT